jgi:hypothetical protein
MICDERSVLKLSKSVWNDWLVYDFWYAALLWIGCSLSRAYAATEPDQSIESMAAGGLSDTVTQSE